MSTATEINSNNSTTTLAKRTQQSIRAWKELQRSLEIVLQTYSNVHRGSGHFSRVSTELYELARLKVLEYANLPPKSYTVVFTSLIGELSLKESLKANVHKRFYSGDLGLDLGVVALVIRKSNLPKNSPVGGGGTTKLIGSSWVIWADSPDRFEPGTPAVVNVIAFAKALTLVRKYGSDIFTGSLESLPSESVSRPTETITGEQKLLSHLKQQIIGHNIKVPTLLGDQNYIHLDNSASTLTFQPVWEVFRKSLVNSGDQQESRLTTVKNTYLDFLNASPEEYEIVFTRNTTEAIHLLSRYLPRPTGSGRKYILSSMLEHSSNDIPWRSRPNTDIIRLECDQYGFFDKQQVEEQLKTHQSPDQSGSNKIELIAVSGASNVLGSCNSIEDMASLAKRYQTRLLIDAAQLIAHRQISLQDSGVDFLVFSAHKIYAPFGCGVLVFKKGQLEFDERLRALLQEFAFGNLPGIEALGKSLELICEIGFETIQREEKRLLIKAAKGLQKIKKIKTYGLKGIPEERLDDKLGILIFEIKNMMPSRLANSLASIGGIGVRYGCHCAHIIIKYILKVGTGLEQFQKLLQKLIPSIRFQGVVRASVGIGNTEEDVDRFLEIMNTIAEGTDNSGSISRSQIKLNINEWVNNRIELVFRDYSPSETEP